VGYGLYNYFKKQVKLLKDFEWKFLNLKIQNIDLQLIKGVVTIRFTSKSDLEFLVEQFVLDVYSQDLEGIAKLLRKTSFGAMTFLFYK
jgi:hypothetical protein